MMNRKEILDGLRHSPTVDVCVLGGGINGISVFRELALQGVSVLLVEKRDYCSGASAALSRMVHGGLRYLENGEFSLVQESLVERDRLLHNAPHYVAPLPTTVPIFATFSVSPMASSVFSASLAVPAVGVPSPSRPVLASTISWRASGRCCRATSSAAASRRRKNGRRSIRRSAAPRPIMMLGSAIPNGSASSCCATLCLPGRMPVP